MPKRLQVRELNGEERATIDRLMHSRTASVREVERARIIDLGSRAKRVAEVAAELGRDRRTVRLWLTRFNAVGLAGLADDARGPSAQVHRRAGRGSLRRGLDQAYVFGAPLRELDFGPAGGVRTSSKGLPIKCSRIDELLLEEGIRWRSPEGWFAERAGREKRDGAVDSASKPLDPESALKRERSRPSTPSRRRTA